MTTRRGYADTSLGQLHYAQAGDGPVLLMLHQTPRSHDEFAEVQPLLADSYRTIAMDMPGFGSSAPLAGPVTIEALAEGGWALLDALGVERAVLLGHHTGAAVAQEMAVQAPQRTVALVLSAMPWVDAERRANGHGPGVDEATPADDGSHL
ncbi:MAG: alpha/beta fold hydrolase, partial [Streptomyces sp.]|nr:alpha/beta fold hydrolase [Streptomyces sp.]